MKKIALFVAFSFVSSIANAGIALPWIQTADVNDINQAIVGIIQYDHSKIPILFPSFIPAAATGVDYYASYDVTQSGYNLYIDTTADCHGAHYCNALTLSVSNVTITDLTTYRNLDGQIMTTTILMQNGNQANYTQGFAMGDYWNPQIAWHQNKATYNLSWTGIADATQTRKAMTWMVNNLQIFAPAVAAHS